MSAAEALDAVEESLRRRFRVKTTDVVLADRTLSILHPESAEDLIDERDFERDERLPYWAELWPSAKILGEKLLQVRGDGRALVELGCGAGLVATCAALAGFEVTATDYYEDALRFTRLNVVRNGGIEPRTRLLDWRHLPPAPERFDVVVASDVLYERTYGALVARTIGALMSPAGEAMVADPGRVGRDEFLQTAADVGMSVRRTECPYVEGEVRQTITVYALTQQ